MENREEEEVARRWHEEQISTRGGEVVRIQEVVEAAPPKRKRLADKPVEFEVLSEREDGVVVEFGRKRKGRRG